jgi:hypothetical protein
MPVKWSSIIRECIIFSVLLTSLQGYKYTVQCGFRTVYIGHPRGYVARGEAVVEGEWNPAPLNSTTFQKTFYWYCFSLLQEIKELFSCITELEID